jgi:hypothetical protein
VHLGHLQKRMEQTGHWQRESALDLAALKELLTAKFGEVDFNQAKNDVSPFLRDADELALWSREFFVGLLGRIEAQDDGA